MIEGLRPYPEYKESGQEWLGKVPAHWDLKPGHAAFSKRKVPNLGLKEKTVLSLSYGKIKVKATDKQHGLVPESYETYQIVNEDNIIIRGTDLQNDHTSLRIGLSRNRGIISSAYICLETRDVVLPDYGYQILNVFDLTKAIYRYGSGLRQNLDHEEIKRLPIFIPPTDEQTAIVRFLDHANRKIDRFIRTKRKLIVLLNEQKQAIIHHAVTRGLNPDVPLKPSGIPWLGDIPEHWDILRSKYIYREVDERSKLGEEIHLSMSQKLGLIPNTEIKERRLVSESYTGAKLCRKSDMVLNRLKAHLGVFALAPQSGLVSPDYTVLRPIREFDSRYFEAVYRSPSCRVELRQRAKGIVQGFWRLYTEDFYSIRMPVPPASEQTHIMDYLDAVLMQQNSAITRTEREIGLIQEYRTRLTADIVTGQLDVREAAARLPEESEEPETVDESEALEEEDVEDEDLE